jgi:hypothetical protein
VYGSPPSEPAHSVFLGVVTKANANTGEIFIKVQNGYELDEIHDVSVGTPTAGDVIQWATDGTTYMWRKKSLSDAGISATSHAHSGVYDPAGTAASAVSTHEAASDPHPTYLTATEGNAAYAATSHSHSTSDITSGNFVATVSGGTGVTVTSGTGNASTPSIAIGQAVGTTSNVTFNQVTASDYIALSGWNQAGNGRVGTSNNVTVTTAGTYYAIGGSDCEVSFTPDFVGQKFFVTMTGYAALNTTTIQYAFVRVSLTDSSNTVLSDLGFGRSENFGTSGRGGTVAFNSVWTSDTTSARKIKLYGTTQTTNGLVLTLSYWQLNVMALA